MTEIIQLYYIKQYRPTIIILRGYRDARRIKSEIEEGMEWLNWDETIKSINECGRNLSDFRDLYRDEIFEQIETLEEDMVCLKKMLDKFRMVNCEEWDKVVSTTKRD